MLPCSSVSDHDGPYVILNTKLPSYEPRFKIIRDEKAFNPSRFENEVSNLPFSVIDHTNDPDDKLQTFNSLLKGCIDEHAPLKKIKVTRPAAPWLRDEEIRTLQTQRNECRYQAHQTGDVAAWQRFRDARNKIKRVIREAKLRFYKNAFSSRNPKEVWKIINNILHPPPQRIKSNPDELNAHFSTTAQRVLNVKPTPVNEITAFINSRARDDMKFRLKPTTVEEVLNIIKDLKSGVSTGPDNIPMKFIKIAAKHIAPSLTNIINSFIADSKYPNEWKTSRVCMIPKITNPVKNDDYRPINILPVFSKVFEKIVLRQVTTYIDANNIYKQTISGFRKGFSTGSALLHLRDTIRKAMSAKEITLMTMIDFSKAFETIDPAVIIQKLDRQGFSKSFLHWALNYLTNRKQYTQIDANRSSELPVHFGVPQGSILGPVLFNLYVNDMSDFFKSSSIQYADDTTVYESERPANIKRAVHGMNTTLEKISSWSSENSLAINQGKTKYMFLGTNQLLQRHEEKLRSEELHMGQTKIEETKTTKLLGVEFDPNLKWNIHVSKLLSSCYAKLTTLRKIKNFTPSKVKKRLVETLIFSKIDFNDHIFTPLTCDQIKKLQRLQLSAASFVTGRYAKIEDVRALQWLPITERREFNLLKLAFKAIHCDGWPTINALKRKVCRRELRDNGLKLETSMIKGTFQDTASSYFNKLPSEIRQLDSFPCFCKEVKNFLLSQR